MQDKHAVPVPEKPASSEADASTLQQPAQESPIQPAEPPQAQPVQPTQPVQPADAGQTVQQPPQAQYAYAQPPYPPTGTMPDYSGQRPSNGKAVGALVCGILAILFSALPLFGIILGIVAIVLASQYRKAGGADGKATGGKVCGIIGIVFSVIAFVLYFMLSAALFSYVQNSQQDIRPLTDQEIESILDETDSGTDSSDFQNEDYTPDASASLTEEESAAEAAAVAELDRLANADEAYIQEIAARIDEGFTWLMGYSHADIGVDPADLARWMLADFSYVTDGVFIDDGEATVYAEVELHDSYEFIADFYTSASEMTSGKTDAETMARLGELYMQTLGETTATTEYYTLLTFHEENGQWVLDQEDWDNELDFMFMIYY